MEQPPSNQNLNSPTDLTAELIKRGFSPQEAIRIANGTPPPASAKPDSSLISQDLASIAAEAMSRKAELMAEKIRKIDLRLPAFREASISEMQKADTLLREAGILQRREKYKEAEAKCREAINANPSDSAAIEILGDIYQGVARIEEAMAAYLRAVAADPKRASAERKYGDLLMQQQNWNAALPDDVARFPFLAIILSLLLPGLGQLYNGQYLKSAIIFAVDAILFYLLAFSNWGFRGLHLHGGVSMSLITCFAFLAVLYIVGLVDANLGVKSNNNQPRF